MMVEGQSTLFPNDDISSRENIINDLQEKERMRKREIPIGQQLIWKDDQRAIPNELVRCALFSSRNRRTPRRTYKEENIALVADGYVEYTGEELRQLDLTVWLQMIHLGRDIPCGNVVRFKAHAFCKALGWGRSVESYKRLRSCLTRMQATSLKVFSNRIRLGNAISMIPSFSWKEEMGDESLTEYEVTLAPKLVDLFGGVYFTRIEWQQRLTLPDGLATWLHGYFASHKKPFPISLEKVRDHCGSDAKNIASFKQKVTKALDQMKEVGFLEHWSIEGNIIHVVRAKLSTD